MSNTTRRTFLKGLAYTSALSLGGISSFAMAKSNALSSDSSKNVALPTCDIHLLPTQNTASETLSLFNHTDANVTIDGIDKVNLDDENKFLVVKVNRLDKQSGQDSVTLAPGETMEFLVSATSSDYQEYSALNASLELPNVLAGQLKVNSDHQAFNGIIPVTVFDSKVA